MTASSFLPKDYEVKEAGNDFLKLSIGDNKIRVLSDALIGKTGWKGNKPFRRSGADAIISADEVDTDEKTGKPKISDFMAFYAYSYNDDKVVVAEFTQVGIKKELVAYASDPEWGHPRGFDITITKTGEGFNTKYSVKPSIPKPLAKTIQSVVEEAEESFDLAKALNVDAS